jgi:putative nucleotidyltransferase with HDIG domain
MLTTATDDAPLVPEIESNEMVARVRTMLTSPGYRPPMLPGVALEVMQLSQKPKVQFGEVVQLMERDAMLAAKVLAMSQSAAFAARSPITSLYQATVRLGLNTLRDMVLEAALHLRVFRVPGFEEPMERLARHSTAVAHLTRAACARVPVDAGAAFACGLLHDVGFAGTLLALSEDRKFRYVPYEAMAPALDELHEETAGIMTKVWKLPPEMQRAVATHHSVAPFGKPLPMNAALVVAEQLAWEAGLGLAEPPDDADPTSTATPEAPLGALDLASSVTLDEARQALALNDLGMAALRAEAFQLAARMNG